MSVVLKDWQRNELHKTCKHSSNQEELNRARVILLHAEGWNHIRIAKSLNIDPANIPSYLSEYLNRRSIKKLTSECKLNPEQTEELIDYIDKMPGVTTSQMLEYIERRYKQTWTRRAITLWLEANGFSFGSKQVLYQQLITKWSREKTVYRSISGWFRRT